MPRERIQLEPITPWSLRLFDALPWPPLAIGLAIGLLLFALFLAYTTAFGPGPGRLTLVANRHFWLGELLQCLLIGFAPAVSARSVRGSLGDFEELTPYLRPEGGDVRSLLPQILHYPRARMLVIGALGIVGVGVFLRSDPEIWTDGRIPPLSHPDVIWLYFRNSLLWWCIARGLTLELSLARGFSTLGDRLGALDLLDRTPLRIFGRHALRSVLLWMLFVSFYSLMYAGGWAADILGPGLVGIVAFASAAFLLPVLGARRRVQALKHDELVRLRGEIRSARDRVIEADPESPLQGGRLADLVAYEQRVSAVAEWPFDGSTVLRFALYLSLGIGSWVGGALVERAVEATLE